MMSNPLSFEEQYYDVLRAIETQIYEYYLENPDLTDFSVEKALNGMVRTLTSEQRGKPTPKLKLNASEQSLYKQMKSIAVLYLGEDDPVKPDQLLTHDEMIACFKRIQRSLKQMSGQGRQGYGDFLKQFFGD